MQTILPPSGNTIKILGKARSAEHGLRWMTYVLAQPVEGGVLVFHTLTRALLLLTPEEYAAPDNLPELRSSWFRVPQEDGRHEICRPGAVYPPHDVEGAGAYYKLYHFYYYGLQRPVLLLL